MYPVLHSIIERGSKKAAAAGLKIPLHQHKNHKQHEYQKYHQALSGNFNYKCSLN